MMTNLSQEAAASRPIVVRATDPERKYPYLQVIRIVYMVIAGGFLSLGLILVIGVAVGSLVDGKFGPAMAMPLAASLAIAFTGVCAAACGELIKLAIDIQSDTRAIARKR